jgi:hypothetical protein
VFIDVISSEIASNWYCTIVSDRDVTYLLAAVEALGNKNCLTMPSSKTGLKMKITDWDVALCSFVEID